MDSSNLSQGAIEEERVQHLLLIVVEVQIVNLLKH